MVKKKIISTGISGLVGSRIVELLGRKYDFVDFSLNTGIDITNFKLLKKKFFENKEADIVLHLAAFTDVDKAWQENGNKNGACYKVNTLGTENISRLCKDSKKYLVHISTDYVFDGRKKTIYSEYDLPKPVEWYGKTKFWAEKAIKESGCKYLIARIAFPFKAKKAAKKLEPMPKLDLVRKIIKTVKAGKKFQAYSDQIITPTFIDDIAKSLAKIFVKQPRGIFHLVGSTPLSPYELSLMVCRTFNLDESRIIEASLVEAVKENKNFRPRQRYLALSNFKLKDKLGINPKNIRQSLRLMKEQMA